MASIETLTSTTFGGRRFFRKQLAQIQETVATFGNLSLNELALTLCEHLNWKNPAGKLKVNSCLDMLAQLETLGLVTLPAKRKAKTPVKRVPAFEEHPQSSSINASFNEVGPISLQRVICKADRQEFRAYIQTHHYLGYKHPFGSYLAYFIVSEAKQQKLGCLLFSASAAKVLAPRDEWIGWEKKHREKLLHLIINNDRFLIFPWVNVPNLASHVLSRVAKQIGDDWVDEYKYRPVLIETFVDTTRYTGACYRAANWQYLGQTKGRQLNNPKHEGHKTIKEIFALPLAADWRETLIHCHRTTALNKKYRNDLQHSRKRSVDDGFVALWKNVAQLINEIAQQYDEKWRVRKRVINSMMIILLVFRLVCSKNAQSYGTTIDELWDSCRKLNLPLPQDNAIAPSSFCDARKKLDETVFKDINQKIIETYAEKDREASYRLNGHRLFAVDGSKINLPRGLMANGYKLPSGISNYPQGLLSCLYQVKSQMPFDFDLVSHANERTCAEQHLLVLEQDDIVVYDRGYFSYLMLHRHLESNIHAVFRLYENSGTDIKQFLFSEQTEIIATVYPSRPVINDLKKTHPEIHIVPRQLRLVKYQRSDETLCLGTTLLDQNHFKKQDFVDIYHARWGVEELYKISKRHFIIEDFHAKNERGVKQEVFAHFALITMNRIFANQADIDLNQAERPDDPLGNQFEPKNCSSKKKKGKIKTNFKNCIQVIARGIEELLILHANMKNAVERAFQFVIGRHQKKRPGRSYPRKSMRPIAKWHASNNKSRKKKIYPPLPNTSR